MSKLLSFPVPPLAYTQATAANLLSISLRTLDNLIAHKELTVRRVGRRVLVPATSITAFLKTDPQDERESGLGDGGTWD